MESLSRAYVQAIAAAAGVNLALHAQEFDYGVDGAFHPLKKFRDKLVQSGFPLEFQLKASTNWKFNKEKTHVIHSMDAAAHNKIVDRNNDKGAIPKILILLCLPKNSKEWLQNNEDHLLLKKCCYWERLAGELTHNERKQTIRIPRTQHLNEESLVQLLENVRMGVWK